MNMGLVPRLREADDPDDEDAELGEEEAVEAVHRKLSWGKKNRSMSRSTRLALCVATPVTRLR